MALRPPLSPIKPSLLERAIEQIAPQWALKRHQSRAAMALGGGYVGAGYSERFAHWQPGVRDADGDTVRDLRELRARSRDLVRNSPIAAGAIETQCTHIVGSGLTLQSRIDAELLGMSGPQANAWQSATERRFRTWANSPLADAGGELTFAELQELALRTELESGDAFPLLASRSRPDWPFTLAIQIIEADRVSNPNLAADTPTLTAGIERTQAGEAIAVHVCSHHPGSIKATKAATWTRVPLRGSSGRRNILHLKRQHRPGQSRGIPSLAPIIGTLKQMARYAEAEIDAAVNAAAQAVFVKMDAESFSELFDDDSKNQVVNKAANWDGTLRSGSVINLLPGESIDSPDLGRPNPNFDPFMSAFMRFVGVGLNIPAEVLMKHFQSSYSAARAALLDAWRTFSVRRARHAAKFCQPIYEEWLADEIAAGNISAPGFFADPIVRAAWCGSTWSGDGPGAIDPLKEAKAQRERMDIGVTTLADEIVAFDGGDYEQKHRQRTREVADRVRDGLQAPVTQPLPGAAPAPQAPRPEQDELDDD
jgi:lambda family phage portal protein